MSITLALAFGTAAPFADLESIDRQVAQFTGAVIGEEGGAIQPVDRRLRLRTCVAGLALSWRTTRRETVTVQCGDAQGWRLFVPVQARAPVAVAMAVPVVNRGEVVTIAIQGRGFSVSRQGEALESGAVGTWIKVRPATDRRFREEPIRARVIRPGLVGVMLP